MGRSRTELVITGNHGCNRKAEAGESLGAPCTDRTCVDCRLRETVASLAAAGADVEVATLTHWPDDAPPHVVDDLKTGTRKAGSFARGSVPAAPAVFAADPGDEDRYCAPV